MSVLSRPSIAKSVQSSFQGCPAASAAEVVSLAKSFGVGVVAIRPSGRLFSGWIAVCSFRCSQVAGDFSYAATAQLLGDSECFCVVRRAGRRFRVSVPCLSPALVVVRLRRGVRLGQLWVQLAK